MSKPVKIIAILVGIVVALVALAIIALVVFVDPNRYRDDIIGAVKTHTGRDLQIEGKLKLSVFPWLGLETGALQLANAQGFGKEPFARVESAGVQVQVLPLLRKQIVVEAIRLEGLALNLARDKQGHTNWQDMVPDTTDKKAAPPKQPGAAGAAALAVNKIEVRNANVVWDDQQSGAHYAVRGLDLTSANILGSAPAPIKLAFDLETGKPPLRNRVALDARANVDLAKQALNVPELMLNAGPLTLKGNVTGTQLQTAPKFNGRLEVARFNARDLLKQLGIAYAPADPKALTSVGLSTRYNATTKSVALSELALTLDDTRMSGSASLASFTPLAPRFDLAIDRLDIDRYLPSTPKETKGDAKAEKDAPAAQAVVIPLALLREFDTQGKLKVQALKAFGIQSQDIAIQVSARNGKIALGPNTAKLYGGSYSGRTAIDASGKVPRFQFNEKLANVQLGPFLKDADIFTRYSGTGNVELNLTGQGLDGPSITRTLSGTAAIALRDGKVQGVNLQKLINDARAAYDKLRGKSVQTNPQPSDETAFQSLTANIKITNGVARNDDLKLVGPVVRAEGQGSADLVREKIDYRLRVTLSEGAERKGTTVPVTISGPFASPKYGVDVGALFKEQAGESLQKKRESLEQKLEDKLRKKLKR